MLLSKALLRKNSAGVTLYLSRLNFKCPIMVSVKKKKKTF